MENELRFAVLIDADNISDKYIKIILEETANNGVATYKRIYGDWTSQRMNSWKSVLLDNSVIPMQQYSYTYGKNATDSAMIIDAMDILYSGNVDGFCLASSDSDFTRLAVRIREEGMQVIGMGESKTPQPFISACNQFKYLDLLYEQRMQEEEQDHAPEQSQTPAGNEIAQTASSEAEHTGRKSNGRYSYKQQKDLRRVKRTINTIIDKFSDDDDWIFSGRLGDQLSKRLPDFDVRNFGFSKFTPFIRSLSEYEVDEFWDGNHQKQIYVRRRKNRQA
jgi:hypothetical protein